MTTTLKGNAGMKADAVLRIRRAVEDGETKRDFETLLDQVLADLDAKFETLVPAPRCATIGCGHQAVANVTYNFRGDVETEAMCEACIDAYKNRPAIKIIKVHRGVFV